MTRVSDAYPTVIRGVSQQVPHDRIPGQHWEQDNLNSDPVRGLSRRHGSLQKDAVELLEAISADDKRDASARQEHTLFVDGTEYGMLVRPMNFPDSQLDPVLVVNKDTRKFVDLVLADEETRTILDEGVSAITAAGRYVLLASAQRPVTHTIVDNMAPTSRLSAVWVRGGANSRTFTLTITQNGTPYVFSYQTLPAYYQGVLDTSDLNPTDPNYAKYVNDRVNAYNTAVNQHIANVARDITPQNIAFQLAVRAQGVFGGNVVSNGSYILVDVPDGIVTCDDMGNGELMRACSREVTAPELVTPRHYPGKVIKVVPKAAGSLAYYLRADSADGSGGFGEVVWREVAGRGVNLTWVFCVGTFHEGKFQIGRSPESLAALTGLDVPKIEAASSGDQESNPLPEFFDRVITYMRMFQDRLMIVAGSTVFLSKSGDYFNFFRKSVLTVADDDPIEVFAQGTEDDVITGGVQHDRNVILCGQRYQYIVPGRENMTPRNPYVGVQSSYEGANLVQHAVAGSLLFFCQRREKRLTLQRMQPGAVADRLDALDISSQLDGYLTGTPRQIIAMTAPGVIFMRTAELTNGFYVYSYLDAEEGGERLFDSWSRWSFDSALGVLAGLTADDSGLLAVTVRDTKDGPRLVLDRFTRETGPSDMPYLDSMQPVLSSTFKETDPAYCAFDAASNQFLVGLPLARSAELLESFPTEAASLWAGTQYDSFVTLSSPYIRDRDDKIILDARLTISKLTVSLSNSAAMQALLTHDMGKTWVPAKSWSHRIAGAWVLNTQGIAESATVSVPVMKENKTYRARLSSRSWLPMTVASVEWAGQAFTSRS